METHRVSGIVAAFGLFLLLVCIGWTAIRGSSSEIPNATLQQCKAGIAADPSVKIDWRKAHREFAILAVWPPRTAFNRTICVIVAGVAPGPAAREDVGAGGTPPATGDEAAQNSGGAVVKAETEEAPAADASQIPEPVRLFLFLNNLRADQVSLKAKPIATPQTLLISLQQQEDFSLEASKFWRDLLHSGANLSKKVISVGFSRAETDTAEIVKDDATTLVVFDWQVAILGAFAFLFLVGGFILYVRRSGLLRDDAYVWIESEIQALKDDAVAAGAQAVDGETPQQKRAREVATRKLVDGLDRELVGFKAGTKDAPVVLRCTYSLAKSQMAFWLILSITGFLYIWLTTGQYFNLITTGLLVLLGISGTTGLAAIQLTDQTVAKRRSNSFLTDILSDGDGPQLYRLQALAWTVILGVIFVWHVIYNFRFADFDQNLLIMIGISQSLYLGFKARDKLNG